MALLGYRVGHRSVSVRDTKAMQAKPRIGELLGQLVELSGHDVEEIPKIDRPQFLSNSKLHQPLIIG